MHKHISGISAVNTDSRPFVDIVIPGVHLHNVENTMRNTSVDEREPEWAGNEIAHYAAIMTGPRALRRLPFTITMQKR